MEEQGNDAESIGSDTQMRITDEPDDQTAERGDIQQASERGMRSTAVRITPRDLTVLRWIADQTVVRLDTVQTLLGRNWDGQQRWHKKVKEALSERNTLRIIDRWSSLTLIEMQKPFAGQPYYFWLSKRGLYELGLDYKVKIPSFVLLHHYHQINQVRMWFESAHERMKLRNWRSERQLRAEWGDIGNDDEVARNRPEHTPDAVAEIEIQMSSGWKSTWIAIEAELTYKKQLRLHEIISKLAASPEYKAVWYFVNEQTRDNVIQAVAAYQKFAVYDIATFQRLYPI